MATDKTTTQATPSAERPQSEADTPTPRAATASTGETGDGKVTLTLAHPLDNQNNAQRNTLRRLGLDVDREGGYKVGEQVRVHPADGRSLIGAGYVQVDPEDNEAVAKALDPRQQD
jgi:hypothetical protein